MYSKNQIFNLALDALLLQRTIVDAEGDPSSEAKTLRRNYDLALFTTLQELDLDATSNFKPLELVIEKPNDQWCFAYKYPSDCAFFRKIQSCVRKDSRLTRVKHNIGLLDGQRVIFTDKEQATGVYIPKDINISVLNGSAVMAVAYKLANLSSSLIVGKGAGKLRAENLQLYIMYKAQAQQQDQLENDQFQDPLVNSEFVQARMS